VTNKHVSADNCFIRFNLRDGGTPIEEVIDWDISDRHDLSIVQVNIDFKLLSASFITTDMFLSKSAASDGTIIIGDDVFMVGRFVHADGKAVNVPSVRCGHLSMTETTVGHERYNTQDSFVAELRSVCGYSGSPVFCYPSMFDTRSGVAPVAPDRFWLLGIHWGYILEPTPMRRRIVSNKTTALRPNETGNYTSRLTLA